MMLGGAEDSARNWAQWLVRQGHDVAVIRAADRDEADGVATGADGVRVHVVRTAHVYAPFRFPEAPGWQKPIWHMQDHFAAGAAGRVGAILDAEAPDLVNVHLVQGLGYGILRQIAQRRLTMAFTLHDLGLACIRMSMFKNGEDCGRQCAPCAASSRYKAGLIRAQARVGFVSPSRANLETLRRFFPVDAYPSAALLNPNAYPAPTTTHRPGERLRLLYAGKLEAAKGVDLLLEAVATLADAWPVEIAVAGRGPLEAELHARYGQRDWCRFLGFVSQQVLADAMATSDLFCIPSVWAENSPGVVVQALGVGLPVMGSARGGIPELVQDGVNGRLVRDMTAGGWSAALRKVAAGEEPLADWRAYAEAHAADFGQDALGHRLLRWMEALRLPVSGASAG